MKKNYFFIFSVLLSSYLFSQEILWQKNIQSSTQEILSAVVSTADRQLLIAGSSISKDNLTTKTRKDYDFHLLKLNQQGNTVWEKFIGGNKNDYLSVAIPVSDGGFLVGGNSFSNLSGDKKEDNIEGSDIWLLRLNENGEEAWQKTLGESTDDELTSAIQTKDGGFYIAGNIDNHPLLYGGKDAFVTRLDKNGKINFTTFLGGKGIDKAIDIKLTADGGVVVLLQTTSAKTDIIPKLTSQNTHTNPTENDNSFFKHPISFVGKEENSYGGTDYWMVKLDKNGKQVWQKTWGGSSNDFPKKLGITENGYVVVGESESPSSGNKKMGVENGADIWMLFLDNDGNETRQKSYNFGGKDIVMSLDVIKTRKERNTESTKGFLLGGYTQAVETIKSDDEKFWMLYIDLNGNEIWRKHLAGKEKKREERLVSSKLQNDGSFLLAGTSTEEAGEENWKILKLGDKELDELVTKQDIRIYPNPVENYCYVEIGFDMENGEEAEISLHDMSGRQAITLKTRNQVTKINTTALPQGIYVVSAKTANKSATTKILKR